MCVQHFNHKTPMTNQTSYPSCSLQLQVPEPCEMKKQCPFTLHWQCLAIKKLHSLLITELTYTPSSGTGFDRQLRKARSVPWGLGQKDLGLRPKIASKSKGF